MTFIKGYTPKIVCCLVALIAILSSNIAFATTSKAKDVQTKPDSFVKLSNIVPSIQQDIRYYSAHNFVGKPINGYQAPICEVTLPTAKALSKVQTQLIAFGLSLKVYDCYRPQRGVNDFIDWAKEINNIKMRDEFYRHVNKDQLFQDGYIAMRSGHSRGSTVDLTIVPLHSDIPTYDPKAKLKDCSLDQAKRSLDNSLDFGTGYDCFSLKSHPGYQGLTPQVKLNRLLLKTLMLNAGFKPLSTEWWHFTLKNEPYPNTYFNFPIKR